MIQIKTCVALVALAFAGAALAEDLPEFNGGDLVVTANGVPQQAGIAPASVTVVTAQEIANSSASNVTDVLASVGGVHAFNMGGSASVVDLAGFGLTGMSNTLILVDGVKQNANDQSPADINYVPLSSIERIEIVRGSGAVAYGDGATGGVINIITKAGYHAQSSGSLTQTIGSFGLSQTDLNFNLAGDRVSLDGFAHSMTTDNFRSNDAERNNSGGLGVNFKFDDGGARLYFRSSEDDQRLPGSLYVNVTPQYTPATGFNQFNTDFSGTNTPGDYGSTQSHVIGVQANDKLGAGRLYFDAATREKTTMSDYVSLAAYDGGYDARTLSEDSGSLRYVLPFAGNDQWLVGTDWLFGDATDNSSGNYYSGTLPSVQTITSNKQRHQGLFSELQADLWSGARATVGGRTQRVADDMQCNPGNSGQTDCLNYKLDREMHAWQLGLRQAIGAQWSAFVSQAQSFRLPNTDDVNTISAPLKPQLSHDQQIGLEWAQGEAKLHVALFRSDITNEIHYLPGAFNANNPVYNGANVNLAPTRHQGVNLEGQLPLNRSITLSANFTWQQAYFRSGMDGSVDLTNHHIPMVPSIMANLGVSWQATEQTKVGLQADYVGAQRMDGDEDNTFDTSLPAYTVVDAKVTHQFTKAISGSLSVQNLFDRHYASYGDYWGASSGNEYSLTPSDPRNFQASVTWAF